MISLICLPHVDWIAVTVLITLDHSSRYLQLLKNLLYFIRGNYTRYITFISGSYDSLYSYDNMSLTIDDNTEVMRVAFATLCALIIRFVRNFKNYLGRKGTNERKV